MARNKSLLKSENLRLVTTIVRNPTLAIILRHRSWQCTIVQVSMSRSLMGVISPHTTDRTDKIIAHMYVVPMSTITATTKCPTMMIITVMYFGVL